MHEIRIKMFIKGSSTLINTHKN